MCSRSDPFSVKGPRADTTPAPRSRGKDWGAGGARVCPGPTSTKTACSSPAANATLSANRTGSSNCAAQYAGSHASCASRRHARAVEMNPSDGAWRATEDTASASGAHTGFIIDEWKDRKRVGQGKSVSVGVDHGGRRCNKKKKKKKKK